MPLFGSDTAAVRITLYLASAALAMTSSAVVAGEHEFGEFVINVTADDSAVLSESNYQITVENQSQLLARLTAAYDGKLSNTFVTDLNRDGAFEVIVTFSYADGHETGVHLYTWNNSLLEPRKVAALDAAQRGGYRGDDEFAVVDSNLVRIFQIYEQIDSEWQPTEMQRRLRYSFDDERWIDIPGGHDEPGTKKHQE